MEYLSLGKILKEYREHLTEHEQEELQELRKQPLAFQEQATALHRILFKEEEDFMLDSSADAKDRARGINPMSAEYIERVNAKRAAFGVKPLSKAGYSTDASSRLFSEEVVRQTKNYKELLELKRSGKKQVVYVDMDNTLVNFQSGIDQCSAEDQAQYRGEEDNIPGIFSLMQPNEGAIEAYTWLSEHFDTYILSTAPWGNPSAWRDKLLWVKKYLPEAAYKRLILSHHKNLLQGDFIIDDRDKRGVSEFQGKHLHFGPDGEDFKTWKEVMSYMKAIAKS